VDLVDLARIAKWAQADDVLVLGGRLGQRQVESSGTDMQPESRVVAAMAAQTKNRLNMMRASCKSQSN
jgi:hypothetical protein